MRRLFLGLPLIGAMTFAGGSASAMPVTAGTAPFEVDWSCSSNLCSSAPGTIPPSGVTLTGSAVFSNPVFTTEAGGAVDLSINVSITNTTQQGSLSTADWQSIRLTSWAFDTLPDATGASTTGATVFQNVALNKNFPGYMQVDVCLIGGQNCDGGANGGLAPLGSGAVQPGSDAFTLNLTGFLAGTTTVDFGTEVPGGTELFDVKFQTNFGSFEFQNQPACMGSCTSDVPEPTSLALLGSALIMLGVGYRRHGPFGGMAAT